jgi:hypothetical protein
VTTAKNPDSERAGMQERVNKERAGHGTNEKVNETSSLGRDR